MKGSELCFFHDPVIRTHREDLIKLNEVPLHRSQDLHRLLARAVKAVERKKINPQQAYAMGWLVQLLLQTSQGVEKEKSYHESQSYGMLYRDLYLKLRGGEKMPEDEYGPDEAEDAERLWMKEGG